MRIAQSKLPNQIRVLQKGIGWEDDSQAKLVGHTSLVESTVAPRALRSLSSHLFSNRKLETLEKVNRNLFLNQLYFVD